MRQGLEISVGVIAVFALGWVYGAATGFAWRGLYDAWFRRTWDRLVERHLR